jgi:hypothetical protein
MAKKIKRKTAATDSREAGATDWNCVIQKRNNATRIDSLRKIYGGKFAHGYGGNTTLASVLHDSGMRSLGEYLKRR